ncbi:HAD hydrolase-like protein [Candidatus Sumerlaeota bacterium]|nr:HAD hydrolase-like protein [Candidatus Sumerlaeota bacterium]
METRHDPGQFHGIKNVLLDIDDTLWENNIFFLQSLEWLCTEARNLGIPDRAATNLLNHWETFNIRWKGYGYDSYESSLLLTVAMIARRAGRLDLHMGLRVKALAWTTFLKSHPIQWRPEVEKALPQLTERFRTIVVTKGNPKDQMGKVDRCGMRSLFAGVDVVPHKHPSCYHGVMKTHGLNAEETVMIGNSPRSDINNAKRAGLRTIYVPHPKTWYREMEPIASDEPPTIQVEHFGEVLKVLR